VVLTVAVLAAAPSSQASELIDRNAHRGTGVFCYGFFGHGSRPPGKGTRYRATVIGPGVTPDVYWESPARSARTTAHTTCRCSSFSGSSTAPTDDVSPCSCLGVSFGAR
jgi:hypothetical protein